MHLQDAGDDANGGDGDFGALEPEQRRVDHRTRRRPHLLVVVQRLSHALCKQTSLKYQTHPHHNMSARDPLQLPKRTLDTAGPALTLPASVQQPDVQRHWTAEHGDVIVLPGMGV